MITSKCAQHGATINDLAASGKIEPVSFVTPDGVLHEANSCWAATEYLKTNGYYDGEVKRPITWLIEGTS